MQCIVHVTDAPEYPPNLPIPERLEEGRDERDRTETHLMLPPELHQLSSALCAFWAIVCDWLLVYHHADGPKAASPAFALSMYQRLLSWADGLSSSIAVGEDNLPQVTTFQYVIHPRA